MTNSNETKATTSPVVKEDTGIHSNNWRISDSPVRFSLDEMFDLAVKYANKAKENMVDYEIGVGTDSQVIKHGYRFVTVLCVYLKGKGGMYYYLTDYKEDHGYNANNKKMRMFDEVSTSIEVANLLFDKTGMTSTIHIDASPEKNKHFTSGIVEQLKGYAISCGFEVKIKPESYCANALADRLSKHRATKKARRHQNKRKTKV